MILLEALQSLYLIPRTPSPVPLEDRPVDELTPDEMRQLIVQQRVWQNNISRYAGTHCTYANMIQESQVQTQKIKREVKRERSIEGDSDNDNDDIVVVKQGKRAKTLKSSISADTGVETIDLLDD